MADYEEVAQIGDIPFALGNVTKRQLPGTLKSNLGKTLIEKKTFRNTVDVELTIEGILDGRTYHYPTDKKSTIEWEREQIEALEDGYKHSYSDGKHSFNAAIRPGTLTFDDSADVGKTDVLRFKMTIIQWSN